MSVHIGGASAFISDSPIATPQLLRAERLDYLVYDYLAEVTMSMLGQAKAKDPQKGFATSFVEQVWKPNIEAIARRKVKVLANAGGVNPLACRDALALIADERGVTINIAVVHGDDLLDQRAVLAAADLREMFTGAPFPAPERLRSVNAYLGAFAIAEALSRGADVVVTGRVADSALALAALIHEFGWRVDDYDLLAAGTLVGHILECGAQATGGLFTDWEKVPDWAHIGYPIAECFQDGSFNLTKAPRTGGLCSRGTVAEQLVYEIGDPQAYIVPDVVCDFSNVEIVETAPDIVHVRGARGYPPPESYKVCATYRDGYRANALYPVLGIDAPRKARRQAEATLQRCAAALRAQDLAPFRASRIDLIGAGATYGPNDWAEQSREVLVKLAVEHEDRAGLETLLQEWSAPMTSMACGTTNWYGNQPTAHEVVQLYSFTLPKERLTPLLTIKGETVPVKTVPQAWFNPRHIERPQVPETPALREEATQVRLIELAWARSGDKGDKFNIGVIAREPAYLPYIRGTLTADFVRVFFQHEFESGEGMVERFDLPGIDGLNFLLHGALGGGGAASLRVDMLAKGKAQQLLECAIRIPCGLLR